MWCVYIAAINAVGTRLLLRVERPATSVSACIHPHDSGTALLGGPCGIRNPWTRLGGLDANWLRVIEGSSPTTKEDKHGLERQEEDDDGKARP
jgi:hypothetical protein